MHVELGGGELFAGGVEPQVLEPPLRQREPYLRAADPEGPQRPGGLERLPGAVYAYEERVGGGRVVAFAEDLNYRAFTRGANRLFLNAVVLGPSSP